MQSRNGERFLAEAKLAASKLLPESSEASGASGDEDSVDTGHSPTSMTLFGLFTSYIGCLYVRWFS